MALASAPLCEIRAVMLVTLRSVGRAPGTSPGLLAALEWSLAMIEGILANPEAFSGQVCDHVMLRTLATLDEIAGVQRTDSMSAAMPVEGAG